MKKILVVYHSQQSGNTHHMAELVCDGCNMIEGVEAEMINVNETRVDIKKAEAADAYALGSPDYFTYMAGGLKQFFDDILLASWGGSAVLKKPYVAFMTHGGGGGGIASIEKLAESAELVKVADSVLCKGSPEKQEDVEKSIQLGKTLAEYI
jgi:multimeric flavodoxin WrbA